MYNNWPWVTCGCGGHCNDFCLAAVESELVQCHPLLHVLYTTGEAVGSPLRLVTWYLNIQLGVISLHMIMDTVFGKCTAEIVAVYIKKQRSEYTALCVPLSFVFYEKQ